jgi:hypothetical protein
MTEPAESSAPDADVRRHDLAVALQAAANAYRESQLPRPVCGAGCSMLYVARNWSGSARVLSISRALPSRVR